MSGEIAGFVLAAGSGTRLRPLTFMRPKPLCPVNNRPLVDYAVERVLRFSDDVRVNAWHMSDQMKVHFDDSEVFPGDSVRLVVESTPLGTAGALGANRSWIDGRGVLVHNADSWLADDRDDALSRFVSEWDGDRARLLVREVGEKSDFATKQFCGVSLMPWSMVSKFEAAPSGLWEVCWQHLDDSQLDLVEFVGSSFDCGTPAEYLAANLAASGGNSVIGPDAVVEGRLERSVVWAGATVGPDEQLVEQIRAVDPDTQEQITVDAQTGEFAPWVPGVSPDRVDMQQ